MKTKALTALLTLVFCGTIIFAQNTTVPPKKQSTSTKTQSPKDVVYYTCPMHSDMIKEAAGNCPKCGMVLEKKIRTTVSHKSKKINAKAATKTYTCPMHSDVKSDRQGTCRKCGMDLIEKK